MTRPDPIESFTARVSAAISNTPGGRLNTTDRTGLIRRGRTMGLTHAEAMDAIDKAHGEARA